MFSSVHCMWLLVSLCVCGTTNFERFFFVGTIVLRYVLRYVLFISLVFFGSIHVRCVSEMWFRGLLDLCTGSLRFEFSALWRS